MPQGIDVLLRRSEALEDAVFEALQHIDFSVARTDVRLDAGISLAMASLEHGRALRQLIGTSLTASAVALMRPQFEALTRAAWSVWGASDDEIARLLAPLTAHTEKQARKLTGLSDMLTKLKGRAPDGLVQMLDDFRSNLLDSLHSFVHGGIHVMTRQVAGYTERQVRQVVHNSNGLLLMTGTLLAVYGGSEEARRQMNRLQVTFADCLPTLHSASPP